MTKELKKVDGLADMILNPEEYFKAPHVIYLSNGEPLHIPALWDSKRNRWTYDNDKTGIISANLLPGDAGQAYHGYTPNLLKACGEVVTGTCKGDCPGCYAFKMTRIPAVFVKFLLNTIEAKADPGRYCWMLNKELNSNPCIAYKVARIHDAGDFFSEEYLQAFFDELTTKNEATRFYGYTKEEDLFKAYLDKLPGNFNPSCSPWEGHCEPIGNLPRFYYDDGSNPELANLPHCPAVDRNGKRTGVRCNQCLHCPFAEPGSAWAVYSH